MSDASGDAPGTPTLLGVPYDGASSFLRGPGDAPVAIRAALESPSSNLWTESLLDLGAPGMLADAGDVQLADIERDAVAVRDAVTQAVRALLDGGARPVVLGGDHSVTWPVLRAVRRRHPRLTVLHVDAHPDLYEAFEGDRLSHASPFARVMEDRLCDRLVQVGIRTMNGHQRDQAARHGVEVVTMRDWARGARPEVDGPVYLSLDLDALDPAFAPGVSHREPGGLSTREVLGLLEGLGGTLVGADVVEYNPRHDPGALTAPVAAKLVKEIVARMHADGERARPGA